MITKKELGAANDITVLGVSGHVFDLLPKDMLASSFSSAVKYDPEIGKAFSEKSADEIKIGSSLYFRMTFTLETRDVALECAKRTWINAALYLLMEKPHLALEWPRIRIGEDGLDVFAMVKDTR